MGTTLNTKLSRRMRARGELPQINSTSPCMVHEAHVSPGCTRAEMQMARRRAIASGLLLKFVTVSMGHLLPTRVVHRVDILIIRAAFGREITSHSNADMSE